MSTSMKCRRCGKFHPVSAACIPRDVIAHLSEQMRRSSVTADELERSRERRYLAHRRQT